ncbi:MAG: NAD(P)H-hydrate dehydratase [Actinomycetota bacterium]|nr:NAD(P)H-hydrate dehydratase [Actinomycetota bacterium]
MRPLLTPEEMGRADRAAIDSGTPDSVLMDRAGRAVARAVIGLTGGRYGKKVAVVCGKGNNGGDGFVAARVLKKEGLGVRCLAVGDVEASKGAAREHLERMRKAGVALEPFAEARLAGVDVIVDAIFGTGFKGTAEGDPARAIEAMNESGLIVAVDIPSGVAGSTGSVEGPAVRADVTVSMAAQKIGTAVGEGAVRSGRIEVIDIGIPTEAASTFLSESTDAALVLPSRDRDAHKRSGGAVALLVGSRGMTGAAVLTAKGAVRMGAGYATVGGTKDVDDALASTLAEVLSSVVTDQDALGPEALAGFADVLDRADALAIGPGLGQGERQRALVEKTLDEVALPIAADADALNVLAKHTDALIRREGPTVITPHPGELSRLLESSTGDVQENRLEAARTAASRFGCVVLLKGYRSVIARPDGGVVVNPTGGPELATAGTGDVLTGAVAALLAAGIDPFAAAWCAAYVHGLAGSIAAGERGTTGVLAGDVAEALAPAVRAVKGS